MKINHLPFSEKFNEIESFWIGRHADSCPSDHYSGDSVCHYSGDSETHFRQNESELKHILGINTLIQPRQTHSSNVAIADPASTDTELCNVDAVITNHRGIAIGINTADCVPILLYCPVSHTIAAIHAGWRGTASRIIDSTIDKMTTSFSVSPIDIYATIGVAISGNRYEVGQEVVDALHTAGLDGDDIFIINPSTGRFHIDLRAANRQLLINKGVPAHHITISDICTFDSSQCYSARRQGIASGRNFTGIILR